MRKFTAFTLLLTIIIVVVLAEILVNDYLPNIQGFTGEAANEGEDLQVSVLGLQNKLGADLEVETLKEEAAEPEELVDTSELSNSYLPLIEDESIFTENDQIENVMPENEMPDFEDINYVSSSNTAYLRDEQLRSAGFVGAHLEDEAHYNNLFKTISIEDLYDTEITKVAIKTDTALLAKAYIFKVGIQADVNEIYQLIKLRATNSINAAVNETNEFGGSSFYMNDPARNTTAFLTVRIGGLIYAFSYPKEYHSQIKNLIKLLEWELQ